ncbi:Diaminohydroxyphosphoribosylamino-pyrimidine deaminase-like protein [Phanerochaete sordida]|uniref:Diaminohydroxyphosphoribosylamino-pyrimidine deaminase-like protein n=1 Tax=Phanerochaete sordida TaxID=48140 RepID=A0A9P3LHT4_9APHY|nr:Diaminohydroxyphosphoribosylamino-pyrimidine deaminase-like protein [Phanerochaete sordida]
MDPSPISLGLCKLPEGSTLVSDADEEVFLLYTDLAAKQSHAEQNGKGFRGLGYLDNHKDVLSLEFTYPKKPQSAGKGKGKSSKKRSSEAQQETLEVQLAQDKTALRSRKGDTGSVLWRASAELAQLILQQVHSQDSNALLDSSRLQDANVLELGAGTGLLGVVFAPLVKRYTVTDIDDLIPLISKNLALNGVLTPSSQSKGAPTVPNVSAEPLDWVALQNCSASKRQTAYSYPPIDLLLVVDCIYHPSLLPALVDTIDYLSTPERTVVLVVVELRAEDVVREFLELWLAASGGSWDIWHAHEVMEGPYVVWVGWKKGTDK